jgi:hypothetical protein
VLKLFRFRITNALKFFHQFQWHEFFFRRQFTQGITVKTMENQTEIARREIALSSWRDFWGLCGGDGLERKLA